MKKQLTVILILMISLCIFANTINSNVLGQTTEKDSAYQLKYNGQSIARYPGDFSLSSTKSSYSLYKENLLIKTFDYYSVNNQNHNYYCSIVKDSQTSDINIKYYKDNYKTREINQTNEGIVTNNYFYDENLLSYKIITGPNGTIYIYYYRAQSNGSLVAIKTVTKEKETISLINNDYQMEDGNLIIKGNNGLYITQSLAEPKVEFSKTDENLTVVTTKDEITTTKLYNAESLLIKCIKEKDNAIIYSETLTYDDNLSLIQTIETEGNKITESDYESNNLKEQTIKENNVTIKKVDFYENKVIETLYENGEAFAAVTYGIDRMKVISIDYL